MAKTPSPTLHLILKDRTLLVVQLRQSLEVLDTQEVALTGHLDELLIPVLDAFLKRNTIDPFSLAKVTITAETSRPDKGGVDRNSSAYRIVHTWAAALKAAQNHNK